MSVACQSNLQFEFYEGWNSRKWKNAFNAVSFCCCCCCVVTVMRPINSRCTWEPSLISWQQEPRFKARISVMPAQWVNMALTSPVTNLAALAFYSFVVLCCILVDDLVRVETERIRDCHSLLLSPSPGTPFSHTISTLGTLPLFKIQPGGILRLSSACSWILLSINNKK